MNDINYSSSNEEEKTEVIITLLFSRMIDEVLLICKEHLAKLNRERVHRYRKRKREDTSEYMRRAREQKRID